MRRFAGGWILVAAALLVTAVPVDAGPSGDKTAESRSGPNNEVSGLSVDQRRDGTYLRLSSSSTPSFSVYKLTDPLRLVVDVSGSKLSSDKQSRKVDDGVVSKVALLETQEDETSRVRLIVGFAESTHYDVRTDGNDLVIFVEGKPDAKSVEAVRRELEKKEQKLASLEAELERVRQSYEMKLDETRSQYETAKTKLADKSRRVDELRDEVEDLSSEVEAARGQNRQKLRAKLETKQDKLDGLAAKLEKRRDRVDELESVVSTLQAERNEARANLEETRDQLTAQRKKVQRQSQRLSELQSEQQDWEQKLEQRKAQQRQAEKQLRQTEQRLSSARSEIQQLESQQQQTTDASARSDRLASRLADKRRELQELEAALQDKRSRVSSLERKVESLENTRAETRDELAALRDSLVTERQKAERRADKLESLRDELQAVKQTSQRRADQLESLRDQQSEWSSTLASKSEELESTQRELNSTHSKLKSVRRKLESKDRKIAALEEKLDTKSDDAAETERLADRLESLKQEVKRERERAESLKASRENKADKLAELRRERDSMKEKLKQARAKLEQTQEQLAEAQENQRQNEAPAREVAANRSPQRPAGRAEPLDGSEPNTVRDIRLVQRDGESKIVVELERPGEYRRLPWKNQRAIMVLENVELPERLQDTIAASGDSGAVRFVSSEVERPGQVRMEADVNRSARERIKQRGSKLVWEFAPSVAPDNPQHATSDSRVASGREAQGSRHDRARANSETDDGRRSNGAERPRDVQTTSAPPGSEGGAAQTVIDPSKVERVPGMARTRMTLDIRNADIQNVLRMFAKQGDVNIITGDDVSGAITITLEEVPLDRAFLIVLQSQGLGFEVRGSVIRVATQETLRAERKARQEAAQRSQKLEPLEVFMMPINYAEASDLTEQVQRLLSPRGSVSVDERTNTLIIKDLRANIRSIRQLVNTLDTQVPQVLIKARIVETNDNFSREFGIQWGGDFTASQGNGNPTGLAFPNVIGVAGGATDQETNASGTSENPNFAVNLPAAAGTGSGGALGMTLGSIGDSVNLNLRLSAAEESGRAKIVSAPKILTLDNREATISQGTSIPISVVSAAGVQTVFVDATLELTVRPHVTPDGHVQLSVTATKNEPDFQNTGARGDPTIIRRSAETELLIEDGETTVIGGIYTRNSGTSVSGIPVLHKIPILGALFKSTSRSERRSELLIFITPRIVNRADALGNVSAGDVVSPNAGSGGSGESGGGTGGTSNAGSTGGSGGGGSNGGGEVRTRMEP